MDLTTDMAFSSLSPSANISANNVALFFRHDKSIIRTDTTNLLSVHLQGSLAIIFVNAHYVCYVMFLLSKHEEQVQGAAALCCYGNKTSPRPLTEKEIMTNVQPFKGTPVGMVISL